MPKGHDTAELTLPSGDVITLDYTYHTYEERHPYGDTTVSEHFTDWDITSLFLNGERVSQELVKRLCPDYDAQFDRMIRDAH